MNFSKHTLGKWERWTSGTAEDRRNALRNLAAHVRQSLLFGCSAKEISDVIADKIHAMPHVVEQSAVTQADGFAEERTVSVIDAGTF